MQDSGTRWRSIWQVAPTMTTHFPGTLLLEESRLTRGAASLQLDCGSITVAPGGLVVEGVEVRQLLALAWAPHYLSFEWGGHSYNFNVAGVAVIRPTSALFPFA
jgi:hypothetical protein